MGHFFFFYLFFFFLFTDWPIGKSRGVPDGQPATKQKRLLVVTEYVLVFAKLSLQSLCCFCMDIFFYSLRTCTDIF